MASAGDANGGLPDVGMTTLTEARDHAAHIASATSIAIIMEADAGYGDVPYNVARAVRVFESVGVSGIHIEDQEFPKRLEQGLVLCSVRKIENPRLFYPGAPEPRGARLRKNRQRVLGKACTEPNAWFSFLTAVYKILY